MNDFKQLPLILIAAAALSACNLENNDDEVSDLEDQVAALQDQLDSLNDDDTSALGANATQGANLLPEDNAENVWRFAVFPDSQGRDDDNMKAYVCADADGNAVTDPNYFREGNAVEICEYVGVDFNKDGFYDAGTEHNAAGAKENDWDEDGISYLVNVEDPRHPYLETDTNGLPMIVAEADRKDYGPDWKHLPVPLVEAITDKMIELDVDLVLEVGDMTEYRAESDYVQWMDIVAKPLADAGIAVMPVRGNHEIVNGRNWPAWFASDFRWGRQSVNNVPNGIDPYAGDSQINFDQGYKLYKTYVGQLTQEHLTSGKAIGFPGAEDLVYHFTHNNTLFIATDHYFGELYSSAFNGHWSILREWLVDVIKTNAPNVDHVVVFGHEPISSKKRPQTYDVDQYEAYTAEKITAQEAVDTAQANYDTATNAGAAAEELAMLQEILEEATGHLEELQGPPLEGFDIGQLGYMLLQGETDAGLAEEILQLFTDYQITYISGHDHQYSRSLIHPSPEHVDTTHGFTQIITGSASWKSYENKYGINDDYETGLFLNNFVRSDDKVSYYNSDDVKVAESTTGLAKGISFVVVEINGRQITTKEYYADHSFTEVDMNLGAHYDYNTNSWCSYFQASEADPLRFEPATQVQCEAIQWHINDDVTRTTDATKRIVGPKENYYALTSTPEGQDYIGTEATIIEGYNLTFNSTYADALERVEQLREKLTLSWFVDDAAETVSDVLWISGNQTQDGSYFEYKGDNVAPTVDVDGGVLAMGASPSLNYVNGRIETVNNETHVTRDGITNKGIDLEASLDPSNPNGNPGGNDAKWTNRYLNDELDFADPMAISIKAPEGVDATTLVLGRYDEATESWVPAFPEECYIESGYSNHYSVQYRISEQHPEGGNEIDNCQQRYWGYIPSSNSVWGFIHTDGRFALIQR